MIGTTKTGSTLGEKRSMLNRNVKVMHVSDDYKDIQINDVRSFLELEHVRNIILLGDPGSGKTELMKHASGLSKGKFFPAVNFVSRPLNNSGECYFVDALDENRSAENNSDFTLKIIGKLWEAKPAKFRLSSRQQDWRDDYDLNMFRGYFDENGGYIVVRLLPLTEEEMIQILRMKNIASPELFIASAREKKLGELLNNPQNMIMLAEAINGEVWPSTRKDIFDIATDRLIREHNTDRVVANNAMSYPPDDLKNAAGELFALRLLADLPGFRLHDDTETVSSHGLFYRHVNRIGREELRAVLQRRIFQLTEEDGCLDYIHRTVAEFMAGRWLAGVIDNGLPVGRLEALMGRDGFPVTELRGVYAWLSVFSKKHPDHFLRADPVGVITNGDVFSLSLHCKSVLLHSLSEYADKIPRLDTWGETSNQLKAFGVLPLKEDILSLLNKESTSHNMRLALLKMLTPELIAEKDICALCQKIVLDAESHFDEAEVAIDVLLSDWNGNRDWLITFLRGGAVSAEKLRLRADILSAMPERELIASDLINLVTDVLHFPHELPLGSMWGLKVKIPSDITFDFFSLISNILTDEEISRKNAYHIFEHLKVWVSDALESHMITCDEELMVCLNLLGTIGLYARSEESEVATLKKIILPYKEMITGYVSKIIDCECGGKIPSGRELNDIRINSLGIFGIQEMLDVLIRYLESHGEFNEKIGQLYQTALNIAGWDDEKYSDRYDYLLDMGSRNSRMSEIKDEVSFCSVETYRLQDSINRKVRIEKHLEEKKELNDVIEDRKENIILGCEWGIMIKASSIYWGRERSAREIDSPSGRLSYFMTDENISIVKNGWLSVLENGDTPSADEVIRLYLKNERPKKGYVILAASEIYFQQNDSLSELPDNVISSLCVLLLTTDVLKHENKGMKSSPYTFSWWLHIKENRSGVIAETYLKVLKTAKLTDNSYHQSLRDKIVNLMMLPDFSGYRIELLKALQSDVHNSKKVIRIILSDSADYALLSQYTDSFLDNGKNISEDVKDLWNVVRFIIQPGKDDISFIRSLGLKPVLAFTLRDLIGLGRYGDRQHARLLPCQTEQLITTLIAVLPERYPVDQDVLVARRRRDNEGEEFIDRLIFSLAADITPAAFTCLSRLVDSCHESHYRDALRYAQQAQITSRREVEYVQPTWQQVCDTFKNMQPANAADLHALICASLEQLMKEIKDGNTDIWKFLWNEDGNGAVCDPKSENSGTNVLITLLREKLQLLGIRLEPEGHMSKDKRADIAATYLNHLKILTEVKRDYHRDVWIAAKNQLQKYYTPDPQSDGYGIFLVFWYGDKRKEDIALHPDKNARPSSATEMAEWLNGSIASELRSKIVCAVLDVSGGK